MKEKIFFYIFFLSILNNIFSKNDSSNFIEEEFKKFIIKYNKTYSTKEEYLKRLKIFNSTFNEIIKHNKNHTFNYGINFFSDLTEKEFKKYSSGSLIKTINNNISYSYSFFNSQPSNESEELPKSFDYRNIDGKGKSAVNEVVTQGNCGSCVIFSIISLIEAYYFKIKNRLEKFSEQQIVDCLYDDREICDEGSYEKDVLKYIKKKGVMLDKIYPYVSGETKKKTNCKYNETNVITYIPGYQKEDHPKNINIKKNLFKFGPILTMINGLCIRNYEKNIIDFTKDECPNSFKDMNHDVTIIGWDYDNETSTEYWIVRNSWGKYWGMDGYMYVKCGENIIGIENEIFFISSNYLNVKKIVFVSIFMIFNLF